MELPQRYGHYVLLERIAVGGMGEIFRAKYAGLAGFERLCAIKRILPHLSDDPEFVDRLISEAMIAVQLSHTNIVQVYELGKIENEYFIAMEWVDGPDLSTLQVRAKAKDIAMTLPLAIHVVHEVARALDHAHRKADAEGKNLQIVHRDISPQNVMLTLDGAVKLGDFGIARAGGIARRFATGMGAVLGKRRYMSPEQRRGENVDARTDVYALGALLFECVSGHAPDPESPIPLLSTVATDIPPELDTLCAKALAFDQKDRTATAGELAEGLERIFVRIASASSSRAVRDPGPELGRFVRKVCPPGEKLPQKRSLTSRIRAAMRPGAAPREARNALTRTPGMTPNLTQTPSGGAAELEDGTAAVDGLQAGDAAADADLDLAGDPVATFDLPHGADGVTLVRSAIIPAAVPDAEVSRAATVAHAKPVEEAGEEAGGEIPPVMPAKPTAQPTLTASKPRAREDETVLEAARVRPSDIDTDRGPGAPSPALGEGDGTETAPVMAPDLVRASRSSNAETRIQPNPDLARPSRDSVPQMAPDLVATATAAAETMTMPAGPRAVANGANGSSAETVIAPLLPTGAPPRLSDAPTPDLARSSNSRNVAPDAPTDLNRSSRREIPADPTTAPDLARASRREIPADPTTAPPDLARASRREIPADPTTAPPDLSRPSQRAVSAVEVRRARPSNPAFDPATREDELFPPSANRKPSAAPYYAGGAAVLVALIAIVMWSSGVFESRTGNAVATPIALATVPPTATRTPAKRTPTPTPERTVAVTATPRPTPERTPKPTPVKTRIAVAPTPRATPRPAGTGTLIVNAAPWARVTVDGRDLGQTPVKGAKLAAGTYKVVLEHPSFRRVERTIVLKADETEKLIVDFKSLQGEPGPGSP